jgi:uncharacterized protein GlcG (DUF336 family)
MKSKWIAIATIMSGFLQPVWADEEAMFVNTKRLTLPTAIQIAQAAITECTKQGIQIGVTVVDREGIVQVTLRDTIAAQITVPISKGKAYTAANFNAATSALGDRANGPIGRAPGIIMAAGGLPIQAGGSLLGAVGVSGAPSGETDEACAQAGIDAVIDDIEMSM